MTTSMPNGNGFHRVGAVLNKEQFEAQLQHHVLNAMASRNEFFRRVFDPRRNLDDDCGYPSSGALDPWYYRDLYDREPVAERVVSLMPKECWQTSPMVYEDEDPTVVTPFEEAWDDLAKQLRGNSSYFQDEEGSPIWEYLYRGDKLSGIGNFGVILMGFDDGRPLYEPLEGVVSDKPVENAYAVSMPRISKEETDYAKRYEDKTKSKLTINLAIKDVSSSGKVMVDGNVYPLSALGTEAQYFEPSVGPVEFPAVKPSTKKRKLMFLRPFDQSLVQVTQYESNMLNPRFGQPLMYRVTLNDPREYQNTGAGLSLATVQVHWSRVLHLADNLNASEVMGAPRMRPVLNTILDVRKVRGGSAEMFWKGAFPGVALSTHPQLGGDVPVDESSMKDMMENYFNGLQRYMTLVGMNANSLSPTIADPTPYVTVLIEAICVQLGCPVRVFRGSERGELASTQDDSAWNDRLRHRQNNYVTPRIIVPFVDRLIMAGVLPVPNKKKVEDTANSPTSLRPSKPPMKPGQPRLSSQEEERPTPPRAFSRNAESGKLEMPKEPKEGTTETKGGYSVRWPDLDSLGEKDRAAIFAQRMQGLGAYVSGGVDGLIAPKSMLVHFAEFDEEEAQAIIDEQERFQEEEMERHADLESMAEPHDLVPTPPTGFEQKPEPPVLMPGQPGGPPMDPVKMKDGEALVQPDTGKTVAKFPAKEKGAVAKKNARSPLRNEDRIAKMDVTRQQYLDGDYVTLEEAFPVVFNDEELTEKLALPPREELYERVIARSSEIQRGVENCGGPGSGVPGPCPTGVSAQEVHIEKLKAISDEFAKSTGGREEMMAKVDQVLSQLTKEQLKEAAAKFGSRSAKGRKERTEAIKRFISDRREMYQRTIRNLESIGSVGGKEDSHASSDVSSGESEEDTAPDEQAG